MEFRCAHTLHFRLIGNGQLEVKCRAKRCGAGKGNVVLHRFDIATGNLVETLQFKDPQAVFDTHLSEQAKAQPTRALFQAPTTPSKEEPHGCRTTDRTSVRSA